MGELWMQNFVHALELNQEGAVSHFLVMWDVKWPQERLRRHDR